jgi:hypothetical protein
MRNFFLKHCTIYRKLIYRLFGRFEISTLNIPFEIYGDFKVHYLGFDSQGTVHKGFRNIVDALLHRGELGITVLYDRY